MAGDASPPRARLAGALADQTDRLSHCVHCGFCLPACPTYTRLGDEADSPRGRLHLMGAVVEGRLAPDSRAFQEHLDRCLGCRACESVCPSGVEYGFLLERAREVAVDACPPSVLQRLLLGVIGRPLLFRPWMWGSRMLRATGLPALLARRLSGEGRVAGPLRLGMAMLAASAPPRPGSMEDDGPRSSAGGEAARLRSEPAARQPKARGRVAILDGCVQDQLFRRVNRATRRVLEANGWDVVAAPGQGCCGALHAHGGRLEEARTMARRNAEAFQRTGVDHVVLNAAGCGAAMREYPDLLEEGDAPAREAGAWLGSRTLDVSELLAADGRTPRAGAPVPWSVAYDAPCHLLHGQRVADPPLRLLRSIPGVELRELDGADECCGGAGIYGLTHPELGGRIGGDKVEAIRRSGARVVATGNPGCIMQIGAGLRMAGLPVQVLHPVEILDESYRRGGIYQD